MALVMEDDKLYKQRARKALPILVRQAKSRQPIFYQHLAEELGMTNPRNLDYVLGYVGETLTNLSKQREWRQYRVPQIQALVINQITKMPGHGFDGFLRDRGYPDLTAKQKRGYLPGYWNEIYAYPYWSDVLEALELTPASVDIQRLIEKAKTGRGAGGGEGEEHKRLKYYVAEHPDEVGLPNAFPHGFLEHPLPSGDRIDILFQSKKLGLGVEVKSHISNDVDIIRGLFQCVKYRAVLIASRSVNDDIYDVDAVLVLGCKMPSELNVIRNTLGIRVVEITRYR